MSLCPSMRAAWPLPFEPMSRVLPVTLSSVRWAASTWQLSWVVVVLLILVAW